MKLSTEYLSALALLVVGVFSTFGIVVEQEAVAGILTGLLSLYLAVKRHSRGDISIAGIKS